MNKDPVIEYTNNIEPVYKLCKDFGVSVVDFVASGFPTDARQPWRPFFGAEYPWYFWLYAWDPGKFLYNGTPAELYAVLEYEAYPPLPPDPEPDDDPILERLEDLEDALMNMSDDIEELKLLEQRIQALETWKNKPL